MTADQGGQKNRNAKTVAILFYHVFYSGGHVGGVELPVQGSEVTRHGPGSPLGVSSDTDEGSGRRERLGLNLEEVDVEVEHLAAAVWGNLRKSRGVVARGSDGSQRCSRLNPSYEFHFEGLSNFSLSVEGLVQIQDVNPRIYK